MTITIGNNTASLAIAVAPTTVSLRMITPEELKQAGGGASDYLLVLDGIKGESTKSGTRRPVGDFALIADFNVSLR